MNPHLKLVKHNFSETTLVRDHVFFPGPVELPHHILEAHIQQKAGEKRRQDAAAGREGMTAAELAEQSEAGTAVALKPGGPTIETWVEAGYPPQNYPPDGWAETPSPGLTAFRETGVMPMDLPTGAGTAGVKDDELGSIGTE